MLFPREGLLSHFGQSFDDSVRPSLPTVAEPAWFAPPIDVTEDDRGITIVFHVAGVSGADLRVEARGRSLYIWGPRLPTGEHQEGRAKRVFALPFEASPQDVHSWRSGELLRVRIDKKMARVSPDPVAIAA
jgi:HSP20 family molecular chaperone IbpA